MSIIIKGVDIPENFEAIAIITKNETKGKPCYNTVASYYGSNNVIQIPKGHGALKDGSNLVNMLGKKLDLIARERNSRSKSARLSLIRDLAIELYKEPTILESEEEE